MRAQSGVGLVLPLIPLKSHRCSIAGEGEKDKPVHWGKSSDEPAHIWLAPDPYTRLFNNP